MDINNDNINLLVPYKRLTLADIDNIVVGKNYLELAQLGMNGESISIPATELCPTLHYYWNDKTSRWETYALEKDILFFTAIAKSQESHQSENNTDEGTDTETDNNPTPDPPHPDPNNVDPNKLPTFLGPDKEFLNPKLDCYFRYEDEVLIFDGVINHYEDNGDDIDQPGNYVGVILIPHPLRLAKYKDSVTLELGENSDLEILDSSAFTNGLLYLTIRIDEAGQEYPITIKWGEDSIEKYFVAVTQESVLL